MPAAKPAYTIIHLYFDKAPLTSNSRGKDFKSSMGVGRQDQGRVSITAKTMFFANRLRTGDIRLGSKEQVASRSLPGRLIPHSWNVGSSHPCVRVRIRSANFTCCAPAGKAGSCRDAQPGSAWNLVPRPHWAFPGCALLILRGLGQHPAPAPHTGPLHGTGDLTPFLACLLSPLTSPVGTGPAPCPPHIAQHLAWGRCFIRAVTVTDECASLSLSHTHRGRPRARQERQTEAGPPCARISGGAGRGLQMLGSRLQGLIQHV